MGSNLPTIRITRSLRGTQAIKILVHLNAGLCASFRLTRGPILIFFSFNCWSNKSLVPYDQKKKKSCASPAPLSQIIRFVHFPFVQRAKMLIKTENMKYDILVWRWEQQWHRGDSPIFFSLLSYSLCLYFSITVTSFIFIDGADCFWVYRKVVRTRLIIEPIKAEV